VVSESDVYRWLLEAVKAKSRIPLDSVIHVSELTGCLRKAYYLRKTPQGVAPSNTVKLLGDMIHASLQEVLEREGYLIEFKVGLSLEGFRLEGHIDAYHPEKGIVLEFKTESKLPDAPYEPHLRQAQIYAVMTKAKYAYVIYISRSDGGVKVFEAPVDKNMLKWAVERAKALKYAVDNATPPPPERGLLCNYCDFRLMCYGTPVHRDNHSFKLSNSS